jgi:cytochrome c-type biogenesis protein CcmH
MNTLWRMLSTFLSLLFLACSPAWAEEAQLLAEDPKTEARLQAISAELRCLVCQNETIAASSADLADDLRREIRVMIQAGKTDREITDFMVARYGDFILYRPRFAGKTLLLWLGPFLFLIIGGLALLWVLKRRNQRLQALAPLSAAETQALEALLQTGTPPAATPDSPAPEKTDP